MHLNILHSPGFLALISEVLQYPTDHIFNHLIPMLLFRDHPEIRNFLQIPKHHLISLARPPLNTSHRPLLPQLSDLLQILSQYITYNGRIDFLFLEQLLSQLRNRRIQILFFAVAETVKKGFFPVFMGHLCHQGLLVLVHYLFEHVRDERILVGVEKFIFYLFVDGIVFGEEGEEEGFGGAAAFQGALGGAFDVAGEQVALDDAFGALVPVGIPGDGFFQGKF